jgi:hypothetical protein
MHKLFVRLALPIYLLALSSGAVAADRAAAPAPPAGRPCFLNVSVEQSVRSDVVRDIRVSSQATIHFDSDRGTLYVKNFRDIELWSRRIVECYDENVARSAGTRDNAKAALVNAAGRAAVAESVNRASRNTIATR